MRGVVKTGRSVSRPQSHEAGGFLGRLAVGSTTPPSRSTTSRGRAAQPLRSIDAGLCPSQPAPRPPWALPKTFGSARLNVWVQGRDGSVDAIQVGGAGGRDYHALGRPAGESEGPRRHIHAEKCRCIQREQQTGNVTGIGQASDQTVPTASRSTPDAQAGRDRPNTWKGAARAGSGGEKEPACCGGFGPFSR